jgi:RHS repeat-associated protein
VNQKFTGKERDAETGNDYFGARYFSAPQGRWTIPDWSSAPVPIPYAELHNPQTLNLYGYGLNNPLSGSDLDGHATIDCSGDKAQLIGCQTIAKWNAEHGQSTNTQEKKGLTLNPGKPLTDRLTATVQKVGNGLSAVSDWMNDHPLVMLAVTLGVSIEKSEPALEEEASAMEEEAGSLLDAFGSKLANSLWKTQTSGEAVQEVEAGGGKVIAGAGVRRQIDDLPRLIKTYGGDASDWTKITSNTSQAPDGTNISVHAYKNITTGMVVELKTPLHK